MEEKNNKTLKILVLDGGGSKGVYTLGVLKELELKLKGKLHEHFDLIYGTSTGSIIAALIGVGKTIPEIETLYMDLIPKIMSGFTRKRKSKNLKKEADKVFGEMTFNAFKTHVGIVAMNFDEQRPLIFKTDVSQAHGSIDSFVVGFGCTISEAVQCSCSAYPIFNIKEIELTNIGSKSKVRAIDGGFIANNSTLFAMIDAHKAFKLDETQVRLLNVGVGSYIEKSLGIKHNLLKIFDRNQFIERVLSANTNTNVQTAHLLFPKLQKLRISETFAEPEFGTNMVESDLDKLTKISGLGRKSFAKYEREIETLFDLNKKI